MEQLPADAVAWRGRAHPSSPRGIGRVPCTRCSSPLFRNIGLDRRTRTAGTRPSPQARIRASPTLARPKTIYSTRKSPEP
jgi:hypothetical protein